MLAVDDEYILRLCVEDTVNTFIRTILTEWLEMKEMISVNLV